MYSGRHPLGAIVVVAFVIGYFSEYRVDIDTSKPLQHVLGLVLVLMVVEPLLLILATVRLFMLVLVR